MDLVIRFLPFIKVISAFAVMLLGIRFKIGLGVSILAGSLGMAFFFGLGPVDWAQVGAEALVQDKFILLTAIVGLILVLSGALEKSGQSRRLMDSISGYLTNPRLRLAFFPALIGLLPMPGGAIFSAPMLKSISERMKMENLNRVLLNYWFRHIWEPGWPLYPGIILAAALVNVPMTTFIAHTGIGVLVMVLLGWLFFLRPGVLPAANVHEELTGSERDWKQGVVQGLPLIIAIVGGAWPRGFIIGLCTGGFL